MFKNSSLFVSKSFSDSYFLSIKPTDEFFESLFNSKYPECIFNINDDIGSVVCGNKTYKASVKYEQFNKHIVSISCYEICCANGGSVTISDSPIINDRARNIEIENTKSNATRVDNMKRVSNQALDKEPPIKRHCSDKNIKYDVLDDVSCGNSKSSEKSMSQIKKDVLEMLKFGKTIPEVALSFNISENIIRGFISPTSEMRQESSREVSKRSGSNNRANIKKNISNTTNYNGHVNVSENKIVVSIDFDISKLNEKLYFGKETVMNSVGKIHIPDDYKRELNTTDFNNNTYPTKSNPGKEHNTIRPPVKNTHQSNNISVAKRQINNSPLSDERKSMTKAITENKKSENRKSFVKDTREVPGHHSEVEKYRSESNRSLVNGNVESKYSRPNDSSTNKFTEPIRKEDNPRHITTSNKRDRDNENRRQPLNDFKHRQQSHFPTEPYKKTQDDTVIMTKALTEPKTDTNTEVPTTKKNQFLVINPHTVDFSPCKSPVRELLTRNPDTEEFRKDVLDTFYRLQSCEKIYRCYSDKREELKKRALASRTDNDLKELYEEYYQLVDEEKQPFFVDLEHEITVLQEKLFEMSNIMGVAIATQ